MNKKLFFHIAILIGLTNCDTGLSGDLKIFNDSPQVLTVKYSNNSTDTVINEVQPNENTTIRILDGLGNAKTFDCCPCRTYIYKVSSPFGLIKKDP